MHHIAPPPPHEPLIREIPLSRMALAPENVRKTPADPVAEAEMKASIATHGLLEGSVAKFGAEVVNLLRRLERGIGG